jgi:hypothetical protein
MPSRVEESGIVRDVGGAHLRGQGGFEVCARDLEVRDVEGYISMMSPSTKVILGGNLTRGPEGNDESKVAIALFPVAHEVNYRTMR